MSIVLYLDFIECELPRAAVKSFVILDFIFVTWNWWSILCDNLTNNWRQDKRFCLHRNQMSSGRKSKRNEKRKNGNWLIVMNRRQMPFFFTILSSLFVCFCVPLKYVEKEKNKKNAKLNISNGSHSVIWYWQIYS